MRGLRLARAERIFGEESRKQTNVRSSSASQDRGFGINFDKLRFDGSTALAQRFASRGGASLSGLARPSAIF